MEVLKAEKDLLTFRVEAAERLAALDKVIREAELSKRSLQFTVRFLGIGTLGGIVALVALWFALDHYVDGKISAQMQKWNDLNLGLSLIRENRWSDALIKLDLVYKQQIKQVLSDEEYRSVLFNSLLWTLASTSNPIEPSLWEGQSTWYRLSQDSSFKAEFLNRTPDQWDETYCNEMFLCTLKFESRPDSLGTIDKYLQTALTRAPIPGSKADHFFQLAMASLAKHNIDDAKDYLRKASENDPSKFNPNDWTQRLNKFKDDALEFKMWRGYTERVREELGSRDRDFDSEFAELTSRITSKTGNSARSEAPTGY
jgi:hypothetical protein